MDERYLKSTAIVRAYQKRMLDSSTCLRLLQADVSEITRLLDGTFYQDTPHLISAGLKRLKKLIQELIVEEELARGLIQFFDFRNASVFLGVKNPTPACFYPDGEIKLEQLKKYISEKKFAAIFEPLRSYLLKIFSTPVENLKESEYISYLIFQADYFYYPYLKNLSRNSFWQNYWAHFIDLTNFRYLLRRKNFPESVGFEFIPGGFLDPGQLKSGLNQDLRQFVQKPFLNDYVWIFDFTAESEYEFLRRLEKNIRKFLLDYLRPAKLIPYGLEPVFAFLESFLLDLRNVSFITRSKKMKIDVETISENCDATYV